MNIKLIHKTTNDIIEDFCCNVNDFEIINKDFYFEIKIQITKQLYEQLESMNYIICWYSEPIISDGSLSEKTLHDMSLSSRKYYITFPSLEMDYDMLETYYGSKIFNFSSVEKSIKIIEYKEKHFKTNNILLYVNGDLIDIEKSIIEEKIVILP